MKSSQRPMYRFETYRAGSFIPLTFRRPPSRVMALIFVGYVCLTAATMNGTDESNNRWHMNEGVFSEAGKGHHNGRR